MTNNQIIRNEAARLDPATLHAIATAHHTPDEIAAIAAACKTTDENGNEQPATVADVEIMLAADELHTFDHWKKEGKSVKKGEKHLVCCYLWKYTTKPSKEQREKAAARCASVVPAFSAAVVAPVQGCFCCLPKGSDSSLNGISLQW